MKRICLLLIAALSLLAAAWAATRPRFGGIVSVEMRGSFSSYDLKSKALADDDFLRDSVLSCVCDRLVALGPRAELRPSLATSWRGEREGRSWYFTLRNGVAFHRGAALTQQMVISSLAVANPSWRLRAEGGEVLIQSDTPLIDLPYELAEPQDSICVTGDDGRWIGSGPFQVSEFRSGQHIYLKAFDQAWQGRPFVDDLRFEMGKNLSDQVADLQLGRADLIEDDTPSQGSISAQVQATEPVELIALMFAANHPATADPRLREAISRAVDRNSIFAVLLRRNGEASAALLPEWISGYAHLLNVTQDLPAARRLVSQVGTLVPISVGYDAGDPITKLIAERVAVNAREAGIGLQPVSQSNPRNPNADATVVRVKIESPDAAAALAGLGTMLRLPSLQKAPAAATVEGLYAIESGVLRDYSIIPIAHIPERLTANTRVHDWRMNRWGEVDWGSLWAEAAQ